MAAPTVFHCFVKDVAHKVHNLGSDTLKCALSNSAPAATNTVLANITEITAQNGYSSGGPTLSVTSSDQASGVYKLILADNTLTATGGSIGPFQYAVIYNATPTSPLKPLIQWYDYGSPQTLAAGESFVLDFDDTLGALKIAVA